MPSLSAKERSWEDALLDLGKLCYVHGKDASENRPRGCIVGMVLKRGEASFPTLLVVSWFAADVSVSKFLLGVL